MCVLFLSRLAPIVHCRALTQGFQTLCGVLKTLTIAAIFSLPAMQGGAAFGLRPTEMIINDPWTGAAIAGYDPVAFFIDRAAIAGTPDHQTIHAGLVWHFVSEGNRAAFEESPESYLPAFGGYDPVAVAAGLPVAGSPRYFLIAEGRVHLFRSAENRDRFASKPAIAAEATRNWPELRRQLAP